MLEYVLLIGGIILLVKSADYLVEGASALAKRIGVSTLVIGLTIVSFGTSFPELIISIIAALQGSGEIVLGNVIGSTLSNTLLILGVIAVITRVTVKSATTWKEIPFALLATLVIIIFSLNPRIDGTGQAVLTSTDGIILLLFFSIFLYYVFEIARRDKTLLKELEEHEAHTHSNRTMCAMIIGGSLGLFVGGKWTVDGAVVIAQNIGMSEFLISATIISIGTSLPELITSIVAALKRDVDLAVGNVIGSNIFNILWVLGATAIVAPLALPSFITFDLMVALLAIILLFVFMFTNKKHELETWEGLLMLGVYAGYIAFIILRG